jgi:hypothetical protein
MATERYFPTPSEKALRRRFLSAVKKCSLGNFISADKVLLSEYGLVIGEFDASELCELTNQLEDVGQIYGAIIEAKLKNKPMSDLLKKSHPAPVDYRIAKILPIRETV